MLDEPKTHGGDNIQSNQLRVPILLPIGRDAELVAEVLQRERLDVAVCVSIAEMTEQIDEGCGPFVVGEEIFRGNALYRLIESLESQPEWSELPGFVLTGRTGGNRPLQLLARRREISLIHRPVTQFVFAQMIRNAVEARRRQYQVRDLLADLVQANEKLRSRTSHLQRLALELTRIEDRERQRIAQILHDDLQQMLASAKLQTEMLSDALDDQSMQNAQAIYHILTEAMKASRSLSHELNPAFIHGENLGTALDKLGDRMAKNFGFRTETSLAVKGDRIAEDIKVFVYRSVQELLFNCAKHAGAGRVSIELTEQGRGLAVTVADDGAGFDPARLKIKGGSEGGFGLFSIQERAIALGGDFRVDSHPDRGSRFVLEVPFQPKNDDLDDSAEPTADPQATLCGEDIEDVSEENAGIITVVIADDHAVMRQGLASLLRNHPDIEVVAEAADGEQAVARALEYRPDVILMDYSMPRLNGAAAARRIRSEAPAISVVGLSMYSDQDTRRRMTDAGAQAYLTKDVQARELIATIKQCVRDNRRHHPAAHPSSPGPQSSSNDH